MNKQRLKELVCERIDRQADKIIAIGEEIYANPEMGFREQKTSEVVKRVFRELSVSYRDGLAETGVKGMLRGFESKATVAVIGEMDAVSCSTHPDADMVTGAAHACGHHAQMAAMLGAAMGLASLKDELSGDVCFFAVPAEEFVEIEYRSALKDKGRIGLLGGKQELIRLGEFDDIDMAMMVHAQGNSPDADVYIGGGNTGFVAKKINFIGKAAHAGGAPHEGVNALNAAMAAMMCIHAMRETFRDEDKIRVHPIITNGGELVNVVPALVTMETYVRGANPAAIKDASEKVDRAIRGACYAIGAECEIINYKGYMPLQQSEPLSRLFEDNAVSLLGEGAVHWGVDSCGSTDMGDLGYIMPIIQPTMGGFNGSLHSKEFSVADKYAAYVAPAKLMAMTVIDLLTEGAETALEIKKKSPPLMTKEEYLEF